MKPAIQTVKAVILGSVGALLVSVSGGYAVAETPHAYYSGEEGHYANGVMSLSQKRVADEDLFSDEWPGREDGWYRKTLRWDDRFYSQTMKRLFDLFNLNNNSIPSDVPSVVTVPVVVKITPGPNEKCTYYASGRIESRVIKGGDSSVPSVDYYHYNDDALSTISHKVLHTALKDDKFVKKVRRCERNATGQMEWVDRMVVIDGLYGTEAYYYEYDAAGKLVKETSYTDRCGGGACDYSDPGAPVLYDGNRKWTYIYNSEGELAEIYTYYGPSPWIESHTIFGGDASGVEYYHYYENPANQISHKVLHTALADGTKAYYYQYTKAYENYSITRYSSCEYFNPGLEGFRPEDPILKGYVGSSPIAGPLWSIYTYEWIYMEEDFYGPGKGRLLSVTKSVTHSWSTETYEYWDGTDKIRKMTRTSCYGSGPAEYEYASDGKTLLKETVYDNVLNDKRISTFYGNATNRKESYAECLSSGGQNYKHYIDESFDKNGNGTIDDGENCGRTDVEASNAADEKGAVAYVYTYYDVSAQAKYKDGYSTVDYSDPSNPTYSGLVVRYEYNADGTLKNKYEYDANGKEKADIKISKELASKQAALEKQGEEFTGTSVKEDGFVDAIAQ